MDQALVRGSTEKKVDRIDRMSRIRNGLSKGVLIHFQFPVWIFSSRKAVRAMRVTMWMVVMAQP